MTGDQKLEIHQVPVWQDNLVWLIRAPGQTAAAAVDGPEAGPVLDYCKAHGMELTTILNTHTHGDHVGINQDLGSRNMLSSMRVVGPKKVQGSVPGINEPVVDSDTIELFGVSGRVMQTEGHLDGHISFVFDDVLFCGDTLFAGGCGYLFDGPPKKMFDSLSRLAQLDPKTRVCCAHEYTQDNLRFAWSVEPDNQKLKARIQAVWALRAEGGCTVPSTIGDELATNPFMRAAQPSLMACVTQAIPGVDPSNLVEVFAATRALKDQKRYRTLSDDALPLG